MIKKKAKSKATKKTTAKKRSLRSKKERNPAAVRNDIAKIVESGAKRITKADMDQAMTGQLAPANYLFEMASIYPPSTDGSFSTKHEESLAETLMRSLGLPDKPIPRDEEDPLVPPAVENTKPKAVDEEQEATVADSGAVSESKPGDESKHSLLA